jgi:hypothetical protein
LIAPTRSQVVTSAGLIASIIDEIRRLVDAINQRGRNAPEQTDLIKKDHW